MEEGAVVGRPLVQIGHTLATKVVIAISRGVLLGAFARALEPADFGAYAVVTTGIVFGLVFLGLNTNQYIYRVVPGQAREDGLRVLASVGLFELLLAGGILALAVASGAFSAALSLLKFDAYGAAFALALGLMLAEIVCQDLLLYLYATQRIGQANILELIKLVAWIPLVLAWWLVRHSLGVDIIVGASLAGASVAAVFGLAAVRPNIRPSARIVGYALRFGVPLLLPGLAFQTLKLFDRFVLYASRGLDETGVYALAASFANLLYSFSAVVIANTLTPMAVRAHNEGRMVRRDRLLWRILGLSLTLYGVVALILWIAGGALLVRLARPEYAAALPFFPWLALGYALVVVSAAPTSSLYLAGRTRTILVIDVAATTLAVGIDLALIPTYGGYGAAAATITGFGLGTVAKFAASGLWRTFEREDLLPGPAEIVRTFRMLRRS